MKTWERILSIAIIVLLGAIAGYTWGYSNMYVKCYKKEPTVVYVPKETIVHDTVTDVQFKERYVYKYDTTYLQCIDTLFLTDTVQVLIPMERATFDTITKDSVHVHGSISGYKPSLDTLTVEVKSVENTVIVNQPERKWHWGFGFALGFGYVR